MSGLVCPNDASTNTVTASDARREKCQWYCLTCHFQWEDTWPIETMATWPTDPTYRRHWVG